MIRGLVLFLPRSGCQAQGLELVRMAIACYRSGRPAVVICPADLWQAGIGGPLQLFAQIPNVWRKAASPCRTSSGGSHEIFYVLGCWCSRPDWFHLTCNHGVSRSRSATGSYTLGSTLSAAIADLIYQSADRISASALDHACYKGGYRDAGDSISGVPFVTVSRR